MVCHRFLLAVGATFYSLHLGGDDRTLPRPATAPGLCVSEWSPEGLYDKCVSWIPNTDEIFKLLKKKINQLYSILSTPRPGAVEGLDTAHRTLSNKFEKLLCALFQQTVVGE